MDHEWGKHTWGCVSEWLWWFAVFSDTLTAENYFSNPKTRLSDVKSLFDSRLCVLEYVQSLQVQPVALSFCLTSFTVFQALGGKLLIKLINFPFQSKNKVVADIEFFWVHCGYTCLWQSAFQEATISAKNFCCVIGKISIKSWFMAARKHSFEQSIKRKRMSSEAHKLDLTIHDSLIALGGMSRLEWMPEKFRANIDKKVFAENKQKSSSVNTWDHRVPKSAFNCVVCRSIPEPLPRDIPNHNNLTFVV